MTVLDVDRKFFEFSAEEFSKMVGFDDWKDDEYNVFRIVQSGSHSWEGMVRSKNSLNKKGNESINIKSG